MKTVLLLGFLLVATSAARRVPAAWVFWGDSIMAGNELNHSGSDGPNNIHLRWPKQYAETVKNGMELNDAQSGATLCSNWGGNGPFETRLAEVETYNAALTERLFIGYGFNDMSRAMGQGLNLSQFLAVFIPKLANAVQYIKANKGWPANKIVIVWNYVVDNPPYGMVQTNWEAALAAVQQTAAAEGVCLLDFHTFWKARSDKANYTDGDLIHPNENANTVMAANADALIECLSSGSIPPNVIPLKGRRFVVQ